MSRYKVLVDSSVWIDYFKKGNNDTLEGLIEADLICINDVILTELAPPLMQRRRNDVLESLYALEKRPLNIDWNIIRNYQYLNLQNGINKVGIPDLIILHQVVEEKITLYTNDNHFYLMKSFLNYELLSVGQ